MEYLAQVCSEWADNSGERINNATIVEGFVRQAANSAGGVCISSGHNPELEQCAQIPLQ
jgi:hypothetical protein